MLHLFIILMSRLSKIAYISLTKTWIGNRRRKYRLMGIEVPPPRGGPADFSEQPESGSSLSALTPGEEAGTEVGEDNDRNDEVSICLSEASSQGTLLHLLITSLWNFDVFLLAFQCTTL